MFAAYRQSMVVVMMLIIMMMSTRFVSLACHIPYFPKTVQELLETL